MDQLDAILKALGPFYIIRSSLKKDLLVSKMAEKEARVIEIIWEDINKHSLRDTTPYEDLLIRYKKYCQKKSMVDVNVKRTVNFRRNSWEGYPWLLKGSSLPRIIVEISNDH